MVEPKASGFKSTETIDVIYYINASKADSKSYHNDRDCFNGTEQVNSSIRGTVMLVDGCSYDGSQCACIMDLTPLGTVASAATSVSVHVLLHSFHYDKLNRNLLDKL